MPKLDLAQMYVLKRASESAIKLYFELVASIEAVGMFCKRCGETDPPDGFYPLSGGNSGDISPYLCNRCDREMRGSDG